MSSSLNAGMQRCTGQRRCCAPPQLCCVPPLLPRRQGRFKIEKRDVPGFREIIVRAFECEDCGRTSEEVELAGQHDAQGVRLTLQVPQGCAATLGRQVLKGDTATVRCERRSGRQWTAACTASP
jgi:hypothetical protein